MSRPKSPVEAADKRAFDVDEVFLLLREATRELPKAAMFELRDRGLDSPFEQLVGSLISARTRDETTMMVCLRLFTEVKTAQQMRSLGEHRLAQLLHGATFAESKAKDLIAISDRLVEEFGGRVPKDQEVLKSFRGIGPKVAALTLAVGHGLPSIAVDIHVHRIANRWGYVTTRSPEETMGALEQKLPRKYWIEINERLVPFGKFVCTGSVPPRCSTCSLLSMCRQIEVTKTR